MPCYCPKCKGTLVSVRTERNHRNGPIARQQNVQPAAGRKGKRALTKSTTHHTPDSASTQVPLEGHVPDSGISNHSDHSALEDLEDYEMHGDEGDAATGHIDYHNVNL